MARIHVGIVAIIVIVIAVAYFGFTTVQNVSSTTSVSLTTGPEFTTNSVSSSSIFSISSVTQSSSSVFTTFTENECYSVNGLPDPRCTPGATNPEVTQNNIDQTICVSGWTSSVRPNETYTEDLKERQIYYYNYTDKYLSDYEEDHLVPLEVGGSPASPYNLWPEPHYGNFTSYMKDSLENYANAQVCDGKVPLTVAQSWFMTNWEKYYLMYVPNSTATNSGGGD